MSDKSTKGLEENRQRTDRSGQEKFTDLYFVP